MLAERIALAVRTRKVLWAGSPLSAEWSIMPNCSNPRPLSSFAVTVNGVPDMLKETASTLWLVSTIRTTAAASDGNAMAAKRRQLTRPRGLDAVPAETAIAVPPKIRDAHRATAIEATRTLRHLMLALRS